MRRKILALLLALAVALPGLLGTAWASPMEDMPDPTTWTPEMYEGYTSYRTYRAANPVPTVSTSNHVLALYADGTMYGWGDNRSGQLGFGDAAPIKYAEPTKITFFADKPRPVQVLAVQDASYVRLINGDIYTCGSGANGRLGQGDTANRKTWTLIADSSSLGVIDLVGNPNSGSVYAVTGDNTLLAVGQNDQGQLGIGSTEDALAFTKVMDNADIRSLHIGKDFAVIYHMDGVAKASGSLGLGKTGCFPYTVQTDYTGRCISGLGLTLSTNILPNKTLTKFTAFSGEVKPFHVNYLPASNGGHPDCGQPYCSKQDYRFSSARQGPLTTDIQWIQYGNEHGILQKADGQYLGWGNTVKKQLGNITNYAPALLTELNTKIEDLKLQGYEDIAVHVKGDSGYLTARSTVTNLGKTWGWGSNTRGKLGVDSSLASFGDITPIPALDGVAVQQIEDGANNTYFVSADGSIYSSGDNAYGQLGQGDEYTTLLSNVPLLVTIVSPPEVTGVTVPADWAQALQVDIVAQDGGDSIKDYAISTSPTEPLLGWQASPSFAIKANDSYYAWARDVNDNVSDPYSFGVDKIDTTPPTVGTITFAANNIDVTVKASDGVGESGIKGIYLDGVFATGSTVKHTIPTGSAYIDIAAEDNAGNLSPVKTQRVPGWFDLLDTLTIDPVEFTVNNQKAIITATSTKGLVAGVHVNGTWYKGNPVQYILPYGSKYLELQAQDINGDRSALYKVRVPGWHEEVSSLSITGVTFAADNSMAQVTALETGGKGIRHISVNGELLAGNPVQCAIPKGVTHLEIYAENNEGDRSALITRRVPGWSEVVTTLQISDVAWLDYNTTVQVTATATGGDGVAGIEINGELQQGNPVIYKIPAGVELIKLQAVNAIGDRSPMVTKQVPVDVSKSTLKVSIQSPDWTSSDKVRVRITAEDKSKITQILAKTSEDDEWADVTDERYIMITANTTVYASAENSKGEIRETSKSIECFDTQPPTVTATQDGNVVNIRATDADGSGIAKILVNNKEFADEAIFGGRLTYQIPSGVTRLTVIAEDAAGNLSRAVELPLQVTTSAMPVIVSPTPEPPPELPPEEVAVPTDPEPQPQPDHEPEPAPEPVTDQEQPSQASPIGQAAAAVGGVGTTAAGGLWYWLRKIKLSKPIEELELMGKKLLYDESEYGGSVDPMDME